MERGHRIFRGARRLALLPAVASLLVSCTQRHVLSREELGSDVKAAISIASETEMSIEYVLHGQATHSFAAGQFHNLARQLRDDAKEMDDSTAEPGLQQSAARVRAQMDVLSRALANIDLNAENAASLNEAKDRVAAARKALEQENASL